MKAYKDSEKKIKLIYVLPNLFTAASLFCGILSIIKSAQGSFSYAAWLILLSLVLDGLDGRVARITNSSSKFGVEYDSLCDLVAFGVAPAMLVFFHYGVVYGKIGVIISAIYAVFTATRLAKFNVFDSGHVINFMGLPCPSAAVFVASWVLVFEKYPFLEFRIVFLIAVIVVALLMVSNIEYNSFKKLDFKKMDIKKVVAVLIVILAILYIYPMELLAIGFTIYIISGLVLGIRKKREK